MDNVDRDGLENTSDPTTTPSFLQSDWWFSIKTGNAWSARRLAPSVDSGPGNESGGLAPGALFRGVGPFAIGYLPYAFPESTSLEEVVASLRSVAGFAPRNTVLLRWDSPWSQTRFDEERAVSLGLRRSPMRIQPPDTVILSLRETEDDLLSAMKPKTRYNIRLASKRGVQMHVLTPDDPDAMRSLADWYDLYRLTAVRDRISIHPFDYYRRVFLAVDTGALSPDDAPRRELLLARHEGDLLGGIVTLSYMETTTYLYGASADIKRNRMASYLLQWEAIRRARAAGDRWYDFFGIPPSDDPDHPMHGLYRFKTGFGGRVVHRAGAWDLTLRPLFGAVLRSAEHLRRWYYFSFKKRSG